jgi:polysaccharide pyruvyl transferase WcaK-like protein
LRRSPVVGVLGHYGNANLGDEAIIHAVVSAVRRRWPGGALYAISNRPEDTARRHGVPAVSVHTGELEEPPAVRQAGRDDPVTPDVPTGVFAAPAEAPRTPRRARRGWAPLRAARSGAGAIFRSPARIAREITSCWRIFHRLKRIDLLFIAGSNQMLDNFGGPWEFPYINLRWSILARLAGCRIAWVSVGAGPLDSPLSRRFVRASLRLADYVSVRDAGSLRLLREIGVPRDIRIFPDLAHGLEHEAAPPGRAEGDARRTVGINPMPMYDGRYWPEWAPDKYARFVSELAAFATALQREGYHPFFFGTHPRDERVAAEALAVMEKEHGIARAALPPVKSSATIERLLAVMESADVIVPTRFHGALLALLVERPTLAICYYRKTRELMVEFGQGEELTVTLEDFRAGDAMARIRLLESRAEELTGLMRQRRKEFRTALAEQYDLVFALVADPETLTATASR